MHWATSAGDSTVWGTNTRDGGGAAARVETQEKHAQMSLSPSAQAVLEQLALLPPPPDFATITPAQEVEYIQASRAATAVAREGESVAEVHDVTVAASGCPMRIYRPESAVDGRGLVLHFHGGGWLTGSIEMSDDACRFLANRTGCVVMSGGYRFAPEHPFPAAAHDAYAAYRWARDHARDFRADGERIAAIGTSAGANLAAAICLRAAADGVPLPVMQVLVYPPLDATFQSPSFVDNATGYYLTADQMRWFWSQYAGTTAREDPLLSPLFAPDVRGQPPALIITAEFDPLRDDGERYAAKLRDAGVAVELKRVAGQIHSFMGLIATVPEARECWQLVATKLQPVLA
jgi:acetyl esterase